VAVRLPGTEADASSKKNASSPRVKDAKIENVARTPSRAATTHPTLLASRRAPRLSFPSTPMIVARGEDARSATRVSTPLDVHAASWSDPRPKAFLEPPTRNTHAHARHDPRPHIPARYVPPPEASASSVAAASGSALARIGKEVLARGRFPGCRVDFVAVRARAHLDVLRCLRARAEHANLTARAKRTPRAVQMDGILDAADDTRDACHVYVTYDHPDSRQTLGVARCVPPAVPEKDSFGFLAKDFSSAKKKASFGNRTAIPTLLDESLDAFESAQYPFAFRVDALFATGLSTAPDPVRAPAFVRALLLEACQEIAVRNASDAELVVVAPRGHIPETKAALALDAMPVPRGAGKHRTPRLGLDVTRYRLRGRVRNADEAPETEEARAFSVAEARRKLAVSVNEALGLEVARDGDGARTGRVSDTDIAAALVDIVGGLGGTSQKPPPFSVAGYLESKASRDALAALETFRRTSIGNAASIDGAPIDGERDDETLSVITVALIDAFAVCGVASSTAKDDVVSALRSARDAVDRNGNGNGNGSLALVMRLWKTFDDDSGEEVNAVAVRNETRTVFIPLHRFLLTAAEHGLLLDASGSGCLIDSARSFAAARLCRPGYRIRYARPSDVAGLVAIEAENWRDEPEMRTRRSTIENRIRENPFGNLVVTRDDDAFDDEVKGGVYFQRTVDLRAAASYAWREKENAGKPLGAEDLYRRGRPYAQLLDIHVDQTFSGDVGRAVGNELRAFVLNVSMVTEGIRGVCAVTRTRGFTRARAQNPSLTYDAYVTGAAASRRDRGLFFHTGGGAVVLRPVQNWRPADVENDGKGTLIEYPLETLRVQRWERARLGIGIVPSTEENRRSDPELEARRVFQRGFQSDDSEDPEARPAVVVEVSFDEGGGGVFETKKG